MKIEDYLEHIVKRVVFEQFSETDRRCVFNNGKREGLERRIHGVMIGWFIEV